MSVDMGDEDSYHYDFTTASEWEIFIARLEEIIHEWKLPQPQRRHLQNAANESIPGEWFSTSETLLFADVELTLTRHAVTTGGEEDFEEEGLMKDLMSTEHDFKPPMCARLDVASMLSRWHGLRDFLVLTPARNNTVNSESKVKILLSSMLIALNNSYCPLPMFVSVHEPSQMFLMGVSESNGVRTEFESVHVARIPPPCKYLSGLVTLFKSKLASPVPLDPITIAARFTYVLYDFVNTSWSNHLPDLEAACLGQLPFGTACDPISALHLFATWPHLLDNSVVDSETYSDLEPSQAPRWSVSVVKTDRPACLLSDYFIEMIQLCSSNRTMRDLLGDLTDTAAGGKLSASLSALTESRVPTISRVLSRAHGPSQHRVKQGPLDEDLLMRVLYFLFPDAEETSRNKYRDFSVDMTTSEHDMNLSGLKSATQDGLVWRLAVLVVQVMFAHGGVKAMAHLWWEFAQEMRFRWEKTILVPGVVSGFPDLRSCLLHQKLQLLNCCIARKLAREETPDQSIESESDSEEEFFDCSDDESDVTSTRKKAKHSLWNQPVGRLGRHGNLRLVETGDHLYIPITQEPTPKTEDQVQEDAEILLQLGCDAQGSELRARMMSAALLSDMESFKAANPGAIIDDFIRWYSPRDWLELDGTDQYGQRRGALSARMQLPGNAWTEAWVAAKPVPARRQKRLFDDTREAEKVLHYLEAQRPAEVARLLLPVVAHATVAQLLTQLPQVDARAQQLIKTLERLTRNPQPQIHKYEELAGHVVAMETSVSQLRSLQYKFPECTGSIDLQRFLDDLMTLPEVEVTGGSRGYLRSTIQTMFADAQQVAQMLSEREPLASSDDLFTTTHSGFPRALSREFVLRVAARRPGPGSAPTSQRLYATLTTDEFRLAGAFSQDTTFK